VNDPTSQFFEQLGRRGHEPALVKASGTLRFDLQQGRRTVHWLVAIKKGNVKVSRENREADAVVRAEKSVFDAIVSGNANAMAGLIRGAVVYEGDPQLLVLFQRLFPAPVRPRSRERAAGYAKGPS
jgi:putative sterol carrier protein